MAYPTILSSPLMVEIVLPFILIFVVVFAILQKTKLLGDGKKQIDAFVALAIGLLVVAFGYATHVIVSLIPFLAVGVVVILIFMLLYGMAFKPGEFELAFGVRATIGVLAAVGVVIATLVATGGWDYISDQFSTAENSASWVANGIVIALVVGAFFWLASNGGKNDKKDK